MIPKIPPMPIRAASLAALALALLAGCNKTKFGQTYGTVDFDHAITLEDVVKMGPDSARAKLVGKIVTFKGMSHVSVRAKNEDKPNTCMQGFILNGPTGKWENVGMNVWFNFGDELEGWLKHIPYDPKDLVLTNPLQLNIDVCDTTYEEPVCGLRDESGRCPFAGENFAISGKVFSVHTDSSRQLLLDLRPTGFQN